MNSLNLKKKPFETDDFSNLEEEEEEEVFEKIEKRK